MRRILVVDDEVMIANGIYDMLREENGLEPEVYCCYSARQALELLDRVRIEIVVTDVKMPQMGGVELFDEIKDRWPRCRVIFLTGHEDFAPLYRASKYRDVRYLLKSEGPEAVLEAVRAVSAELDQTAIETLSVDKTQNAMTVYRAGVLRALVSGRFTYSKAALQDTGVEIPLEFEQPFFLLMGSLAAPAKSYADFLQGILGLQELTARHLGGFCSFALFYDDAMNLVWLVQGSDMRRTGDRVAAVLEIIQTEAQSLLGLEVEFLFYKRATELTLCPVLLPQLQQLLESVGGVRGKLMVLENLPGFFQGEPGGSQSRIRPSQASLLRTMLEENKSEGFFILFRAICNAFRGVEGRQNPLAFESCQILSELLAGHIARSGLEQLEDPDLSLLENPAAHKSWAEAAAYLETVAHAVFSVQSKENVGGDVRLLRRIDQYIAENLAGELSLTSIAQQVHFNPTYLSKIFKDSFHISLSEYISEKRLGEAKRLLLTTELKVQEICERTGNYSLTNFCRFFRKATGLSPQEYRKKNSG